MKWCIAGINTSGKYMVKLVLLVKGYSRWKNLLIPTWRSEDFPGVSFQRWNLLEDEEIELASLSLSLILLPSANDSMLCDDAAKDEAEGECREGRILLQNSFPFLAIWLQ